ncbi:hypothetical protein P6U16_01960 [Rhizobium sp. 32-5/1]|uniref:hypothetical protein n=1 Tax=Rhizobium sp. 32-5/1 TaxID=3019602 RepID=UPI00240D61FF|nr:hypothetical protein [Rhizobium sp. 32-5/1]WEZ83619.1 hypothetical protein P6U16_01960 [Rhizobium sp. 32-5/1]
MTAGLPDSFSRLEFKRSMLPYRLLAFAGSVVIPSMVLKAAEAIVPGSLSVHHHFALVAWCLMAAGCLFVFSRLRARVDFEKPIVIVEPGGVTISDFVTKTWSWASVSKIKFYESGQLKESKVLVFHLVAGGSETISLRPMVGTTGRQLFDKMRAYHRKFGPQPDRATGGSSFNSASWTGLDDE